MLTRKKRPVKRKGGKGEKDNGWSADFWDWWNSNISNTIWFKSLSKVGEGIKWTVSNVMNFIWYVLSDIFTKNLKSVWLYVIVGFLGVGSLGAIAEEGDFDSFDFLFATGGIFHINNFISISTSATNFITNTLGNYNVFTILWLLITTLFQTLGWITMDIISMLFTFKHVFVCSISWAIITTILSSFMIIYYKEILKSVNEPKKEKVIKEKKETKEKVVKEKKAKEPKKKGGKGLHPTIERMFEPDLLEKLNKIPKASMEAMIKENPVPFGYAILCGFMKETDTGYEFSEDSLGMIQLALSNTMNTMSPSDPKEQKGDDWTTVNDSIEAFKFVHTASIHAMVRDGLDKKAGKKGGGDLSKRVPLDKIKREDVDWLSQQDANGFKKAKDHGLLKDGRITELGHEVVQKTVDQSASVAWSMKG